MKIKQQMNAQTQIKCNFELTGKKPQMTKRSSPRKEEKKENRKKQTMQEQ